MVKLFIPFYKSFFILESEYKNPAGFLIYTKSLYVETRLNILFFYVFIYIYNVHKL